MSTSPSEEIVAIARIIWRDGKLDEFQDQCDLDVEDLQKDLPVWLSSAAIAAVYVKREPKP
jgi:hypothetical protein